MAATAVVADQEAAVAVKETGHVPTHLVETIILHGVQNAIDVKHLNQTKVMALLVLMDLAQCILKW